jgi:hypothetical protein
MRGDRSRRRKAGSEGLTPDWRQWYGDFREIARLAFKDKPEWLESLGIRHRYNPRP